MFKFLLFLGILAAPPLEKITIIEGEVSCDHQMAHYYNPTSEELLKGYMPSIEVTEDSTTTENIAVYLIEEKYCIGSRSVIEKIKYADGKYLTKKDGKFWFFAKPNTEYRIYYAVGLENTDWQSVSSKQGINKIGKYRMLYRIYE